MIDYIQLFKDRNLFNQCTNEKELNNLLNEKKIVFYIGGPNGYPENLIKQMDFNLSLSKMTMPHEMAALVLVEQLFRAFSIKKGSKYHRD